ncbi:MAG: HAD hydrolase-like protein [Chitinivibrionales bacterium]|nr:HAD hydrolase-like protein [Chitinivibrionales bacterium]MBD3395569.1 HAD hydrolase-like protein [Chitinivibrionales bacterium]
MVRQASGVSSGPYKGIVSQEIRGAQDPRVHAGDTNRGVRPVTGHTNIIWDWNGTLFDDAWLCRSVVNGLLARRGKPTLDEQRYQEVFDFPVRDYYRRAGFDFDEEPYEVLATEFIEEYERRRHECGLREGAQEVVARCAGAGLKQHILSAYAQHTLEDVVGSFGIRHFFAAVHGLDNHYASGKEQIAAAMMAETGLDASRTVLVGDTTHDYDVARAIGVSCVLMPGGHHSRARLETCGVDMVDSLESIPGAL